jgi:hypothetical protein
VGGDGLLNKLFGVLYLCAKRRVVQKATTCWVVA